MDRLPNVMELDDSDAESPDQPSTSHDREDPTTSQNTSQALVLPGASQALDQNLARGLDYLMKEPKKHVTVIAAKTVTFNQKQGDTIKAGNYFLKSSDISFEQADKNREPEGSSSGEGSSSANPERTNPIPGYTVGPGGGTIKLFSYEVIFPQDAVDIPIKTKFYVSDDIDNLTLPSGLIPVSLPLHCAPGGLKFKFPVVFKMPIWCSISKKCKRPVKLYIYKRQKRGQWQYCDEVSLTDSGFVSFTADSFCEKIPAVNSKDLELVKFDLLYFLCKDHLGSFVSVHFVSSDKLAEKLKSEWIKTGYKIIHPPSTKLTVNPGDVLPVNLESKEPEKYKFESAGKTILKVTMEFYERELYKAFSFLLDPENPGSDSLKFVYSVGDVRHLKRALYQEKKSLEHNYDDSPNRTPVFKNIVQIHGDIMVGAGTVSGASDANNARNTEGSQAVGISIEGGAEMEQKSRSLDEQPATSRSARPKHQHKQRNSSSGARSKTTESPSSSQATSSGLRIINQQPPGGSMSRKGLRESLPGYEGFSTYVITYSFPAGSLNGVSYEAKEFTEYLPGYLNDMLQKAFNAGLLFKIQIIGSSRGEIIWNDEIPHKTNKLGGPDNNGYPDDDHRRKLRAALNAKLKEAELRSFISSCMKNCMQLNNYNDNTKSIED
ncbi:uncharacterized protein LOC120331568 isoform X2 [Styela clava]